MNFFSLNLSSRRTQRDTFLNQIAVCSAVSIIFWKLISSRLLLVFCSFSCLTGTRVSKIITETLNPPSKRSKRLQNVIIYDKCLMVTEHSGRGGFGMTLINFCQIKCLRWKTLRKYCKKVIFYLQNDPLPMTSYIDLSKSLTVYPNWLKFSPVSFGKIFSIFSLFCWKIVCIFRMAAAQKIKWILLICFCQNQFASFLLFT